MLHIDYSIIPLTDEDRVLIDRVVEARIEAGQKPAIDKTHYGRVAVVNPDPVQTVHHVPDELRAPLRRTMHATSEGPTQLSAERVYKGLVEGEGAIYALVLELDSEFKHLQDFVPYLARLKTQYPDLGVFLAGTMPRLVEKLQETLAQPGTVLKFQYADARGNIEISDPKELAQMQADQKEPPAFALPFFSQIRLSLAEGQKPIAFNLDTLRKLQGTFGSGQVQEIDMGGGRVEKVVIIDLPTRLIKDFQFRQDRGLDFHGLVRGGTTILSRNFEREKLELRWVPLDSIDALLRRVPGKDVETIDVKQLKALRINTFTGQVSFIKKQASDQVNLEEAREVDIVRTLAPAKAGTPGQRVTVAIDRLIVGKAASTNFDRLHEELIHHYYKRLFMGEEERRVKLERHTRRLTVGAVGPLAGHTLKLLRRYGLERLIDPESFHYVCDKASQLPEHHLTGQRFEEHFQSLLGMVRDIASVPKELKIRVDDITHKMPVITDWIDRDSVMLSDVSTSDLETANREIRVLSGFIDHEFQRQFEIGSEDVTFFKRIETCQSALLLTKWLADYKRGAYGRPLPQGAHPDLVFLGTPAEKAENDEHIFFPALVCSEIFTDPSNRELFERGDYQFSVFLESQLALAEHEARQQGQDKPGLEAIEAHMDELTTRLQARLDDLHASTGSIDLSGSPEYQRLMKQEEEAYHQRYRQFLNEREQVAESHRKAEETFQDILLEIAPQLKLPPEPNPGWMQGAEPDPNVFSTEFVAAARSGLKEQQGQGVRFMAAAAKQLLAGAAALKDFIAYLGELQQAHQRWQAAAQAAQYAEAVEAVNQALPARIAGLKKLDEKSRESYGNRIASQVQTAQSELEQAQAQEELRRNKSSQAVRLMQVAVERLPPQCKGLGTAHTPEQLKAELARAAAVAKRLGELAQSLKENTGKLGQDLVRQAQVQGQLRQAAVQAHKFKLELAAIQAVSGQTSDDPPEPPRLIGTEGETEGPETLQQAFQALQASSPQELERLKPLAEPPQDLRKAQSLLEGLQKFRDRKIQLEKLSARKNRLRKSVFALEERMRIMDNELRDLPKRVEEKFMPARKELLLNVFIPETERELDHAQKAKAFIRELSKLDMEEIKRLYLDRAVFRRFASRQFLRGAQIANNVQSPSARGLHNVQPALNLYTRILEHNFRRLHPDWVNQLKLEYLKTMEPGLIWNLVTQLHGMGKGGRYGYLVLPGTLPIDQAVRMMNQKDQLYNGLPTLVLVFVGKFDASLLHSDAALRDNYFRALKHNVILNIDNRVLVDNPVAIGERLAEETLGSASDVDRIEPLLEEEQPLAAVKGR